MAILRKTSKAMQGCAIQGWDRWQRGAGESDLQLLQRIHVLQCELSPDVTGAYAPHIVAAFSQLWHVPVCLRLRIGEI